ncbi:restriction endonuclease [Chryseobacterium sp.]|uniref:restriction endonuclease n=1 Tax=Chryseobacterium sp. TaxID=1871047 RepID=UPI0031CDE191
MRKKFNKKDKARRKHIKHSEQLEKKRQQSIQPSFNPQNISKNRSIPKRMRLNKVVKELNMSMSKLVLLLEENNFEVDHNPNAVIGEEALKFLFGEDEDKSINIILTDPTYEIIEWIRKDFKNLDKLTPDTFEKLIITILKNKGFGIEKSGSTNKADGGIDVIAYKKDIVNIIIAIQIKYKINTIKKVTASEVRDFVGAMNLVNYFNSGMLITNTFFTEESKWLEEKNHNLELKDSKDIQNWLKNNFITSKEINKDIKLTRHNNVGLKF